MSISTDGTEKTNSKRPSGEGGKEVKNKGQIPVNIRC